MGELGERLAVVADFNGQSFANYLARQSWGSAVTAHAAPLAPVQELLINPSLDFWDDSFTGAVVWTRPEFALPSFAALLRGDTSALSTVLAEVDAHAHGLRSLAGRLGHVLVATWPVPASPFLLLQHKPQGPARLLARAQEHLLAQLDDVTNVHFIASEPWLHGSDAAASAKLQFLAKIPYDAATLRRAAHHVAAAWRGLRGAAGKLLVLDLDNTLWGGAVGDVGWEHIVLGGHHPQGEAFAAFQALIQSIARRGVLLAVASKNSEATALHAIEHHPEMLLRRADLSAWRINWQDKAQNISDMAHELNIGLQSVVFVDDDMHERARVQAALPAVRVIDMPADPLLYGTALQQAYAFETAVQTHEDATRAQSMQGEAQRRTLLDKVSNVDDWLGQLQIRVTAATLHAADVARAVQLLNKTNQMNLTTRRLSEPELLTWLAAGDRHLWTFRVDDRLGSSGLTGLASVECVEQRAVIVDFILSCRVFGRRIEDAMVHVLQVFAAQRGCTRLEAQFKATDKNAPCRKFLQRSATASPRDDLFIWHLDAPTAPPGLEVRGVPGPTQTNAWRHDSIRS